MEDPQHATPTAEGEAAGPFPRSVDEIFEDFQNRKAGLLKALTEDVDDFYSQCDPSKENLCLHGYKDGSWSVGPPGNEVPPELPEPCLGINFARDGMSRRDWIALVAVHSDSWLMSVASFYSVRLDSTGRARLFKQINALPTIFETVTGRVASGEYEDPVATRKRPSSMMGRPTESSHPSGRIIRPDDMGPQLKGRQAELFWPDDAMWYLVEIQTINLKTKQAKIVYATGEVEDLDMEEIVRDQHMALL
eukprot:gene13970-19913_t